MVILCKLAGRGDADIAPYGVRWRKTVGQDLPPPHRGSAARAVLIFACNADGLWYDEDNRNCV